MIRVADDWLAAQADGLVLLRNLAAGHRPSERPQASTVIVDLVGWTVTATLAVVREAPLLAEQTYPREVAALREQGRTVAEVVRLASIQNRIRPRQLFSLIALALDLRDGVDDTLIEVNPRHEPLYRRLGFRSFGPVRECRRAGAPAVLLRLDMHSTDRLEQHAGAAFQS